MAVLAKALFGYPNRAADAAFSGGAWTASLPLPNLAYRQIAKVARAVSAAERDTWFYMDLGAAKDVDLIDIVGHNLDTNGQFRLRAFSASPLGVADGVFTADELPDGWSVVRASEGRYFGSDGLLKTAAANEPRFEWGGGVRKGLLVERQAQNIFKYCRDATNANWTKASMTTALTATGIDGAASSASLLTATSPTARISQTFDVGTVGLLSVYLRRVSGSGAVKLSINGFSSTTTVTLTTSWQRFTLAGTVAGTGVCGVQIDTSGDVIEFDFAQFEPTTVTIASSPIYTTSDFVTRNPDEIVYTTASGSFATGAMMLYAQLISRPGTSTEALVYLDDGTANNRVGFEMTTGGVPQATLASGGVAQVSGVAGSAVSAGSAFTAAMSWASNDVRGSFDGGAAAADASATMAAGSPTRVVAGLASTTGASFYLLRAKLYAATKTNAQLVSLSGAEREVPADFDSGAFDAWHDDFVTATTAEKRSGRRGETWHFTSATQSYRYWLVNILNSTNTASPQLGRVHMSGAWQPSVNMAEGASIGYVDRDLHSQTDSGAQLHVKRPGPIRQRFMLDYLDDAQLHTEVLEMQRQLGTSGELFFSRDPTDTTYGPNHTHLCTMRVLSDAETPYCNEHQIVFELEQAL